jgi:hypothetical protein
MFLNIPFKKEDYFKILKKDERKENTKCKLNLIQN